MVPDLPKGSLILADLGYFGFAWFDHLTDLGRSKKLNPDSCGNRRNGYKPFFKTAESLKAFFELSHGLLRERHTSFVDTVNLGNDRLM